MDNRKIGKAIAFLRKRAGYTQKDLADRIGISDKAVSKWERGLSLPDVGYLRKLSILLDTDTDSLLSGDVVHHDSNWKGVLVMDDSPYGIGAGTIIFDKPLVYFLLSYFLLVGIREVTVFCTENDKTVIKKILGDGSDYGIHLTVAAGPLHPEMVTGTKSDGNIMMVYGRCLLYGVDQTRFFQRAMVDRDRLTMMVSPKKARPLPYIRMDDNRKVINDDGGDLLFTQYDFSPLPILFFPADLLPELAAAENVDLFLKQYAEERELYVETLDRGFVEFEVDDWNAVQEASTFLKIVQEKCGMNVYCLEEVAWRRGMISDEQLCQLGKRYAGTEYGDYIQSLYERVRKS